MMTATASAVNSPSAPSQLTPGEPTKPALLIPRPRLPHIATLSTAEDFYFAGMLAAQWLATFETFIEPNLATRVRAYSDRALTLWSEKFFDPAAAAAAAAAGSSPQPTAGEIVELIQLERADGTPTGHDHVYGDGRRAHCPIVAPFTLPGQPAAASRPPLRARPRLQPVGRVGAVPPEIAAPSSGGPADPGAACPRCQRSTEATERYGHLVTDCQCTPCAACSAFPEFCECAGAHT